MGKEPILIIGAIVAVCQVVTGILTNHLDVAAISAAITAVGAVFGRSKVSPY